MEWHKGDLIEYARQNKTSRIAFTANSTVTHTNSIARLVMGAGAAKRVRDSFPGVDAVLGTQVGDREEYNVVTTTLPQSYPRHYLAPKGQLQICAVQVKFRWSEGGDMELARRSMDKTAALLKTLGGTTVMNCPLIGLGGFGRRQDEVINVVASIFKDLDITICTL